MFWRTAKASNKQQSQRGLQAPAEGVAVLTTGMLQRGTACIHSPSLMPVTNMYCSLSITPAAPPICAGDIITQH
jgi:hypothetical protein